MILWSVVPLEARVNNTDGQHGGVTNEETKQKTSSVAFVLIGAGLALLMLAVCLGMRNKHRRDRGTPTATGTQYTDRMSGEAGET